MPEGLEGRTLFITGGSRGIGLAIALRAARDGANVALLAKTAEPHPKLPGTIYTAAEEIEAAGGTALPIVGDVRDADSVAGAVEQAAERFGGIDILVNNASAISLTPIEQTEPKRYDLMLSINVRGTFLAIRACIPHLKHSDNGHILSLSPPVNLDPAWLGAHAAYTLSKYGMSLLTLGAAQELREAGVAANTLWPRTIIATAAVQNLLGGDEAMSRARTPEIYADSAYQVLIQPAREYTGQSLIDDEVLAAAGVTDLEPYRAGPGDGELIGDLFVDPAPLR
ncbi:MAG TPA: NAD(P)-dependent oxidoreductase [Solirubrobacteraceae bacterium]|nr:NAD(P)-dependent oxidoreductase [Solirubrobacteraceae bacterium]